MMMHNVPVVVGSCVSVYVICLATATAQHQHGGPSREDPLPALCTVPPEPTAADGLCGQDGRQQASQPAGDVRDQASAAPPRHAGQGGTHEADVCSEGEEFDSRTKQPGSWIAPSNLLYSLPPVYPSLPPLCLCPSLPPLCLCPSFLPLCLYPSLPPLCLCPSFPPLCLCPSFPPLCLCPSQVKEKEAELKSAEQRLHEEFERLRRQNQEEKRQQDDKKRQLVS